jgi:hypothetical protein
MSITVGVNILEMIHNIKQIDCDTINQDLFMYLSRSSLMTWGVWEDDI